MPRRPFRETRYKRQNAFEGQENLLLGLRKRWVECLNPYHWGVEKIVADTPEQEIKIAREKGIGEYIARR